MCFPEKLTEKKLTEIFILIERCRVRAKQSEKDAGNGREADADKHGGVAAGSKLHASVQSRETVTEAMLVQLRMFVLFDATSKGKLRAPRFHACLSILFLCFFCF
jgi:hypothetical protein